MKKTLSVSLIDYRSNCYIKSKTGIFSTRNKHKNKKNNLPQYYVTLSWSRWPSIINNEFINPRPTKVVIYVQHPVTPHSSWHVVNTDYPLGVLHTLSTVACIFPSIIINCFKPVGSAARALHTYQSRYGLEQHVSMSSNFNDFGLSPTGIEHRAKYIANHYAYCGASCKEHTIPCFDNILTSLLRHIPDN